MIILYGIKNCDSVKKARRWLEAEELAYEFHDFRVDGLDKALVAMLIKALGEEQILNKRSTSWKQLNQKQQDNAMGKGLVPLLVEYPTLIKRPVLQLGKQFAVGFKADDYAQRLL